MQFNIGFIHSLLMSFLSIFKNAQPIKSKIAKDLFPPNLFDNAQREVLTLLENDSYKRFLATQKRITQSPTMK